MLNRIHPSLVICSGRITAGQNKGKFNHKINEIIIQKSINLDCIKNKERVDYDVKNINKFNIVSYVKEFLLYEHQLDIVFLLKLFV